jgi:hypothetical protein
LVTHVPRVSAVRCHCVSPMRLALPPRRDAGNPRFT